MRQPVIVILITLGQDLNVCQTQQTVLGLLMWSLLDQMVHVFVQLTGTGQPTTAPVFSTVQLSIIPMAAQV